MGWVKGKGGSQSLWAAITPLQAGPLRKDGNVSRFRRLVSPRSQCWQIRCLVPSTSWFSGGKAVSSPGERGEGAVGSPLYDSNPICEGSTLMT